MDKTHNFRKNKKNEMKWNVLVESIHLDFVSRDVKSKNLALLGLAVQVEYLSNLYS